MTRLINADALKEQKFPTESKEYEHGWNDCIDCITTTEPTIEPSGDLISRAGAIKVVMAEGRNVYTSECANAERIIYEVDAVEALAMLPSAEATYATCATCAENASCIMAEPDGKWKACKDYRPSAEAVQGWIPFTRRPMTEEEQKDYPNCTFMFDCVLPDDGDEILVSNGRFVWMDVFCNDIDGCYLDGGDDIDEDMAWMPLPKPYKGGDSE